MEPLPTEADLTRARALEIIGKHERETETPIGYWASEALVADIVELAASSRLEGEQAGRKRIRELIKGMLKPSPTTEFAETCYNVALGNVILAIDGDVETENAGDSTA